MCIRDRDKELLVYSLKKDRTIQQAVSAYQKEHNDVYVRYEVGMSGDNGLTAEDAVKALNTEIMAGKGPDVLCLDGLPLDSYLSKGMLADLSDTLKAAEEKDCLLYTSPLPPLWRLSYKNHAW